MPGLRPDPDLQDKGHSGYRGREAGAGVVGSEAKAGTRVALSLALLTSNQHDSTSRDEILLTVYYLSVPDTICSLSHLIVCLVTYYWDIVFII